MDHSGVAVLVQSGTFRRFPPLPPAFCFHAKAEALVASTMAQQLPTIDRVMLVLLHGACHGAWCWDRVRPLLEQAGRDVVTPTLTGLGEREDELSPDVGLSTHVDDVVRVLEQEDLTDVVLVGHSYAGMILPPVAVRAADRLARLVFLDAFVPKDGDRCFDLMPAESAEWMRQQAQAEGGGWRFPGWPLEMLGIVADEDVRWVGPGSPLSLSRPTKMPSAFHRGIGRGSREPTSSATSDRSEDSSNRSQRRPVPTRPGTGSTLLPLTSPSSRRPRLYRERFSSSGRHSTVAGAAERLLEGMALSRLVGRTRAAQVTYGAAQPHFRIARKASA